MLVVTATNVNCLYTQAGLTLSGKTYYGASVEAGRTSCVDGGLMSWGSTHTNRLIAYEGENYVNITF